MVILRQLSQIIKCNDLLIVIIINWASKRLFGERDSLRTRDNLKCHIVLKSPLFYFLALCGSVEYSTIPIRIAIATCTITVRV